jgi:hypothetical protein
MSGRFQPAAQRLRRALGVVLAVVVWGTDSAAQGPGRALELTLTRSVGSSGAAHPPACGNPCSFNDVLAPVSLAAAEVELAIPFTDRRRAGLEYFGRVVPLAYVRENPTQPALWIGDRWILSSATSRSSTIGFGAKPVGVRGWVGEAVRLEADVSAGVLRFGTPLLASNATRWNFTYEFGLGLRTARRGIVIGYRRHHVSNAGIGEVNPGLNSNLIFMGVPLG